MILKDVNAKISLLSKEDKDKAQEALSNYERFTAQAASTDNVSVKRWNRVRAKRELDKLEKILSSVKLNRKPLARSTGKTASKRASLARSQSKKAAKAAASRELRNYMKGGANKKR